MFDWSPRYNSTSTRVRLITTLCPDCTLPSHVTFDVFWHFPEHSLDDGMAWKCQTSQSSRSSSYTTPRRALQTASKQSTFVLRRDGLLNHKTRQSIIHYCDVHPGPFGLSTYWMTQISHVQRTFKTFWFRTTTCRIYPCGGQERSHLLCIMYQYILWYVSSSRYSRVWIQSSRCSSGCHLHLWSWSDVWTAKNVFFSNLFAPENLVFARQVRPSRPASLDLGPWHILVGCWTRHARPNSQARTRTRPGLATLPGSLAICDDHTHIQYIGYIAEME